MDPLDSNKRLITDLPSTGELAELKRLIDEDAIESEFQRLFDSNPNLFAPLEMAEFIRHLRYPKRNSLDPSLPVSPSEVRVPDFDGVHVAPLSTPVIVEMKGPAAIIVDRSTAQLSTVALEVIQQLQTATIHLLRPEGQTKRSALFSEPIADILDARLLELFTRIDTTPTKPLSSLDLEQLMCGLLDAGMALIALIGNSREFANNQHVLIHARSEFLRRGALLITYDELLLMGQILLDYASRDESLTSFFTRDRMVRAGAGEYVHFADKLPLTSDVLRELQLKLFRLMGNVCIYGLGGPPPATKLEGGRLAAFRVSAPFDVGKIWAAPTFLPGEERLLWAGRYEGSWLVVKERQSYPLVGGVVWYEFAPPTEVAPVVRP